MGLRTWYVQEVYTPDDAENDRRRTHSQFEGPEELSTPELAVMGMMAVNWSKAAAERQIKDDADLDGTEVEDGVLSFIVFGDSGEYEITIQTEPFPTPAVYVVMVNDQPVAVRNYQPRPQNLQTIADRLKLPVESFSVVKVLDIDG